MNIWVFKGVHSGIEVEWELTEEEAIEKGCELAEDVKEGIEIWPKGKREQYQTLEEYV